ncbi:MAG TPA: histidine kinase [Bacteroidetes bacterium]|nr:histidine kinase [Bacteroidota bacterium]
MSEQQNISPHQNTLLTNNWMLHVLFWVVYWAVSSLQDVVFSSHFQENFNLPIVLGSIPVVYFNYYYWIPKYLIKQKKYLFYTISILAFIILNAWLVNVVLRNFFSNSEYYTSWEGTFTVAIDTAILIVLTTAFMFVQQWHERNNYATHLEKKNLENELEMLKSQINPHFIFNTLNTIYFLLEQKEGEKAKEALLKFSDTLSHQLYDYNKDWIDLGKEVEYLKNYIELQRLRHDEELLTLKCDLPENAGGHKIAPMLLIPFVENAFKHGSNSRGYKVNIFLKIENGTLHFVTENTSNPIKKQPLNGKKRVGGIGQKNVERRLALIYPERHELSLSDDGKTYKADLKINL